MGNFVYIVTSGPFQGVQGQDYMGWMLVHREHYSVIFVSEKAFYFVAHPKVHLVTHLIVHADQVGN